MTFLRRYNGLAAVPDVPDDPSGEERVLQVGRVKDERELHLVLRLHARIAAKIGREIGTATREAIRQMVADRLPQALEEERVVLNRMDRLRLQDAIWAEIVGYGPIQDLLDDDTVSEVMVNGAQQVWIEREGKLLLTDVRFADDDHVMRIIERMVTPIGRRIDESSPMVDARLLDGSRMNAVIPPLSIRGPVLTVRKFKKVPLSSADVLSNETLSPEALEFLKSCVAGRVNMIIAGGSGSGKTTLLNVLSSFISPRERIVTIEDAAELQLQQLHVIPLESRPPNIEGQGRVSMRDLMRNALRMRPDRIIIGECRGGEALDMLQAMNTGHDGSMTTIHSNGPRDALTRIETMVLLSGADLPLHAIRDQIAAALDLVVHLERLQDGSRRVTQISEVQGVQSDVVLMQDIFTFHASAIDGGRIVGELRPTGIRPAFSARLLERGLEQPAQWFGYRSEPQRARA